jgi:hypothetical protein
MKKARAKTRARPTADEARLREAVMRINTDNLAEQLECLGAKASNLLRPMEERRARLQSPERISISPGIADNLVAILRSLPRKQTGPRKLWSAEIEAIALMGLLNNKPINVLAHAIAEQTGQDWKSVRRSLQKLKASSRLKQIPAASLQYRPAVTVEEYTAEELEAIKRNQWGGGR